jgi:hypothetical protein
MTKSTPKPDQQLLHLVFGGAWLGKARETLDNAQMRYFIVHLHRLLDPATQKAD